MAKKPKKELLAGIDIGTSKIVAMIGEATEDGKLNLLGVGLEPSQGIKKGVIVNIESTVQSIQRAVEAAETTAGCQVYTAYTGIAGSHIRSINSHGIVAIRDKEVTQADVERVIDAAKAVAIPADQRILHILPQGFIIDNQGLIQAPIGMSGVRLEAKVHIVTGALSAADNIAKCLKRCGLTSNDMVLEQFASSYSVLTEDEKELGACLIDIGSGTTDVVVFTEGSICHTSVIPIAGEQVTNDIAIALHVPSRNAEDLKLKYGCALQDLTDPNQMLDVPHVGERPARRISKYALAEVIEARYEELFNLIAEELRRTGALDKLSAGIVLTGGASQIEGAEELAERVFKMPVRLGTPQNIMNAGALLDDPSYATSIGLLLYGIKQRSDYREMNNTGNLKGLWKKMKNWVQVNF